MCWVDFCNGWVDSDDCVLIKAHSQGGSEWMDDPVALKGHLSADCSSANVCLWNRINEIEYRVTT